MPATFEEIGAALKNPTLSPHAKLVIQWQYGVCGSFEQALWEAIKRADESNLFKLKMGFDEHVTAFLMWTRGNLRQEIQNAGLSI